MSTATQLQKLYVAYFGRAADPAGLDYWVAQDTTTKAFASHMHGQDEFQSVYGTKSTEAQVNQIYQNLFNRDADAAGLLYWTNQIETGALALASIANDLIWNVENGHGSASDKSILAAKSTTADAYTDEIRLSAAAILAYQPDSTSPWKAGEDFATAVTFMNTATSTNTPTAAEIKTSVTGLADADVGEAGSTYTLIGSKDENLTGTDDNDTFYALTAGNLTGADVIDGGKGTDKIVAAVTTAATTLKPILKNMETVNIELAQGTAGTVHTLTLDFQDSTGLKTVDVQNTTSDDNDEDTIVIEGINADVAVVISDELGNTNKDNDYTVTYADSGTATDATVTFSSEKSDGTFGTLTVGGIESLTVDSTGGKEANYVVSAADATTLNINASADSGGAVTTTAAKTKWLNITSAADITVDDSGAAFAALTTVTIDSTTADETVTAVNLTPSDTTTKVDTWTITTKGVGKVVADFDGDWGTQSDTNADVFSVDASANSGGTTIDFSGYTTNNARYNTFTGGTGNDNAIVLTNTLDKYDTFNLGAGTADVITTTVALTGDVTNVFYSDSALASAKPTVSGVEIAAINLNGADGARTVSIGSADFAGTVCLLDDINSRVTTIDSIKVGTTIKLGKTLDLTDGSSALVLTQASATAAAPSDSLAITSDLLQDSTNAYSTIDDLRVDTTKSVSLDLASADTDVLTVKVNDLSANKASTVTVTSSEKVTFADIDAADDATLDFSGVTAELSVTPDTANDYTIKGSATAKSTIIMGTGLDADDVITGGSHATDKVTFTANGQTATTGKLNISGIEEIHALATTVSTIDSTSISGGTIRVFGDGTNNGDSSTSITLTNLAADSTVGIGSNVEGTNDTYGSNTTTTITASLADATGSSDAITFELGNRGQNGDIDTLIATTGIETVTIKDSANADQDADIGVAGVDAAKIVVTGGKSGEELDLSDAGQSTLSATTTTVDASAFKGNLDVDASADVATTFTTYGAVNRITGSTGADTATIGSSSNYLATSIGDVDLGTGADTLTAYLASSGSLVAVDSTETINVVVGDLTGTTSTITIGTSTDHGICDATAFNLTGGLANNVTTLSFSVLDGTKTIDASAYLGSIDLTYANDALVQTNTLDPIVLKGSTAGTADIFTAHSSNTNTGEVTITGFETMVLGSSAGANTLDMSNISGLTTLAITNGGGTASALTINDASISTVDIGTTGVAITGTTIDYNLTTITGSSDAVTFNLVNTVEMDVDTDGIETVNIVAKAGAASATTDTIGIAASTVTNGTVNVSGADGEDDVTLDAIASGYTTVSATGLAGDLTIGLAARASTAMTITGGTGSDSIAMENGSDVLDGGTTTGTIDTLVLGGTYNSGGITIDLTSTGDQITLFNGSANSVIQKGFETVDLSGATFNSAGATITEGSSATTIKGTNQADTITAGLGADNIYGGDAIDIVNITEATSSTDKLYLDVQGSKYVATEGMTITGFTSDDRLVIDESKLTLLDFATNVTAGTEKTLIAADYLEIAEDGTMQDEHVIIITTEGHASVAAMITATTQTNNWDAIVGFENTTTGNYEIYDTDTVQTASSYVLLASFTDVTALTAADTFSQANFILF